MVKNIHIFGITTASGKAFASKLKKHFNDLNIFGYSRSSSSYIKFDLKKPNIYSLNNPLDSSILISFGPIWHLSKFLKYNLQNNPNEFGKILGVIATSSTSVLTKRFAFNKFDKNLTCKLREAEKTLIEIFKDKQTNLKIIRPTMIYDDFKNKSDQNINEIIEIISFLPFILFPCSSGKRQPIHAIQLANVASKFVEDIIFRKISNESDIFLNVGGDEEISYLEVIKRIQFNLPKNHRGKKCKIIEIPNRLFNFLISPLILMNQKSFESFLRISANLSGFVPSCKIINSKPISFPYKTNDLNS